MHPLHMNNPAIGLQFQILTGQVEPVAFAIGPLIPNFPAWSRVVDADGHGPAFRTEQLLLD